MYLRIAKIGRKIEIFNIEINENSQDEKDIIKFKLIGEKNKVINRLKRLKKKGLIKSINKPKARDYKTKKKVKELIMANQILSKALRNL